MIIKVIFLDVDGTLVSFRTHRVPVSAIEALSALSGTGVQIVIVTGRGATAIPEIECVPFSGIIGLNGSEYALRDGKIVFRHTIPADCFEQLMNLAEKYDFAVAAKFSEGFVVDRITARVREMSEKIGHPLPPVRDLREIYGREEAGQLCIFTDPTSERAVMSQLPQLASSRWCDIFADVNLAGIDKGSGIKEFAAAAGIPLRQTVAFGDGGNDIPMLRTAGLGVAMGNATPETKAAADYVTDDIDNDGLAKALRRLI